MDETTITISLELLVSADDTLTGCAIPARGERREFLGRLGLVATIDALVDDAHANTLSRADDSRRTP
jgi:hypothetical protein